jgi:hypothetical protein
MNHWSSRRKRFIFLIVLFSLIILVGVPAGFLFYEPPTCFDGKKNSDEEGVDCGGSCQLLCPAQSLPLIPKGDPRVLEVLSGFYNVVAIVENPNATGMIERARYTLRFFESSSITPIKIVEGETVVSRSSTFAVFAGPFNFGEVRPNRATLEWRPDTLIWVRDDSPKPALSIRNVELSKTETEPRVTASLVNNSLERINNVELVALISDEGGNIISATKTVVNSVGRGEPTPIIFTWPKPFGSPNVSVEIIFTVYPDKSYIR